MAWGGQGGAREDGAVVIQHAWPDPRHSRQITDVCESTAPLRQTSLTRYSQLLVDLVICCFTACQNTKANLKD